MQSGVSVELGVLLSAAGSLTTLLKEVIPLTQSIRSGFRASNDDVKRDLQERLRQVQAQLLQTGNLARVVQEYGATLENVIEVLALAQRAERFLKENVSDLRRRTSANYQSGWQVMDLILDSINTSREAPRRAILDREAWYDDTDRARLDMLFQDFTLAYERASSALNRKLADDLPIDVRAMIRPLLDAQTVLRTTEDRILHQLQNLGR